MNWTEMIKQKTLRLIGLLAIAIPLIGFYTILRFLDLSSSIVSIVTVCLSGVAYILLVTRLEPLLRQASLFVRPKTENKFLAITLDFGSKTIRIVVKGPSSYPSTSEFDAVFSNTNIARDPKGNWIHS